jgi:hypothetical protein
MRILLEEFFPKLPYYTATVRCLPKNLALLQAAHEKFIIASAPMKLRLMDHIKRFKSMRKAMGDSDHISKDIEERLNKTGLRFIAKKRKNMKSQNTAEERRFLKNASSSKT